MLTMSEYLGRSRLSEHDPDPESSDHSTPPGHWIVASCETSDALKAKHPEAKVFSSLTDISGEYGDPSMFTEWGLKDNCTPLWADLRYLPDCSNAYGEDSGSEARRDPKPCEHMIYVLEVRSLELTDAEWRAFQSIPEQGFHIEPGSTLALPNESPRARTPRLLQT